MRRHHGMIACKVECMGAHMSPVSPGTFCLSLPTLCLQSISRHRAVPQMPDHWGPSARVLRHEIATGFGHDCRRRTTILAVRDRGVPSICDYSLQYVASRPAKVGDKLVSTKFSNSITGSFAAVGEPNVIELLNFVDTSLSPTFAGQIGRAHV